MGWIFVVINTIAHWKILLLKTQLAYGDLSPFPEYFSQGLLDFFYVWKEVTFGMYRNTGNIFPLIQSLLLIVFRSPLIAQKIYIFSIPLISFFTFKHLLEKRVLIKNKYAIFIASLFYAYCPVSLQEAIGGTQYSTMLVFAIFPLIFSLVFDLINKPSFNKIMYLSLIVGLITSIYAQTPFILLVALLIPFIINLVISKFKTYKYWVYFVFVAALIFLFNPINIISNLGLVSTKTSEGSSTSFGESIDYFLSILPITYKNCSLLNVIRMGNNAASYLVYNESHFWTYVFYIILLLIFVTSVYYLIKTKKINPYFWYSLAGYTFFVLFIWLATKTFLINIFVKLPIMFMFRNPAKPTYIASFYFSILFAFSLDYLLKHIKNTYLKYLLIVTTYITIFIYLWFIWLGDKGLEGARDHYTIPKYFYSIVSNIKQDKQNTEGRSFWLPFSHEDTSIKLTWLDRNKLEAQIGMTNFGGEYYEYNIVSQLIYAFRNKDYVAFNNILKLSQIKYIPLLKDPRYYHKQIINIDHISTIFKNYSVVNETNDYTIFANNNINPSIYTPEYIEKSYTGSGNYYVPLSLIDPSKNYAVIFEDNKPQVDIIEDNTYTFLAPEENLSPFTNMVIDPTWTIPKVPNNINNIISYIEQNKYTPKDNNLALYLNRISNNMLLCGAIANYSDVNSEEVRFLINFYNSNLADINQVLSTIPQYKHDSGFLSLMRKPILFIDESYQILKSKNYISDDLTKNYNVFKNFIDDLYNNTCKSTNCYTFNIVRDQYAKTTLYEHNSSSPVTEVKINSMPADLTTRYANNQHWLDLGVQQYNQGENKIEVNNILGPDRDVLYEYGINYIKLTNLSSSKTYDISFLYSLSNSDTDLSLTENVQSNNFEVNNEKILITKLAKSSSNDFCYVIIDNKCYRKFLYHYNPVNSTESLFINFSQNFNDFFDIKNIEIVNSSDTLIGFISGRDYKYTIPNISYKKINPTKYEVSVTNAVDDYILVLNQSFHDKWQVTINKNVRRPILENKNHFIINGYANAWLIQPSDSQGESDYKIIIEFSPQKSYYINVLIMFTFLVFTGYLFIKDFLILRIKKGMR